jgi:hypothetical protein
MRSAITKGPASAVLLAAFAVVSLACAVISATAKPRQSDDHREKVSAGEYEVVRPVHGRQGIGPFSPAVYNFRESFTLWRLPDGTLEAEGRRRYEAPQGYAHDNKFTVHLSADMRALAVTEFRKLRFRDDSGPLECEFLPREFACKTGSKDDDPPMNLTMQNDYGLFWPVSAFCLGSVAVSAKHDASLATHIQLITVDEHSNFDPVDATVLDATLKFVHRKQIRLAGTDWDADEFELTIPMEQPYLLWTSKDGLVLLFGPEGDSISGPETGLQLVHYESFAH